MYEEYETPIHNNQNIRYGLGSSPKVCRLIWITSKNYFVRPYHMQSAYAYNTYMCYIYREFIHQKERFSGAFIYQMLLTTRSEASALRWYVDHLVVNIYNNKNNICVHAILISWLLIDASIKMPHVCRKRLNVRETKVCIHSWNVTINVIMTVH